MKMRFRAHETFYIRKGWLSKGMKNVYIKSNIFVNKNENPMDILGIGANMVKSLRYWLPAVGLTSGLREQELTDFGKIVYKYDKYIEELGTLYLLHYKLVTNREDATAWYVFFNEFDVKEFTKDDFIQKLQTFIKGNGNEISEEKNGNDINNKSNESVAMRSLEDDFACILNTYVPNDKLSEEPENNMDCPFRELGLVNYMNKKNKTYKKTIPLIHSFNPWIILAVIMDQAKDRKEINLNDLLTEPCNIGKVFNLDTITMLDILHNIEKMGEIKIVRTAGLNVIRLINRYSFEKCVELYYASIN